MNIPEIKISICVGIKDRTSSLVRNLISSLNNCIGKENLELSIFDCGSSDVPSLLETIREYWKGKLVYRREERNFERSYSFNRAVEQSSYYYIFLCDADMSLPEDFIFQYDKNVNSFTCWFPICFSLAKGKKREVNEDNGWWRESGFGMVGISKEQFLRLGGLNENFKTWGGEDNDFYNRIDIIKIRKRCYGLFHNWHPSPNNRKTTPLKFLYLEDKKTIVLGITTYNRINYLKSCINSWCKTRNKDHNWILIIADDGSTDGTVEFIKDLFIPEVHIHIIFNNRKGVHYQTNEILKYCSILEFDLGFKIDDDIIFLKKGWEDIYIAAIEKTGYDHLCFFDIEKGKKRGIRKNPIISPDGSLVSYVINKDIQGAFWTFTKRVIEKVGYFDIENFGFCGYGHIDYTYRCARAGFNDINNIFDCKNSNEYISLLKENYLSAIPDKLRYKINTKEEISRKLNIINDNSRIFIDYKKIEIDLSFYIKESSKESSNKRNKFAFLFFNKLSYNYNYLTKYISFLESIGYKAEVYFLHDMSNQKVISSKTKDDIKNILRDCNFIIVDNWSLLSYIYDIEKISKFYFVTINELSQFENKNAINNIYIYSKNIKLLTDSEQVKYTLYKNYRIDSYLFESKKNIFSFFNSIKEF